MRSPGVCTTGLPDTGQLDCYDDTGLLAACPGDPHDPACATTDWCGQDAQYGQDAADAPPVRFQIIGSSPEEVVIDRITGLRWQRTQDWEAHYHEHWQEAQDYCDTLQYAGHTDWRLPSVRELASLLDFGCSDPAVDPGMWPETPSYFFWSSTTTDGGTTFWHVEFGQGSTGREDPDWWGYARCVRGPGWPQDGDFLVLGPSNEVVLDTRTGLMWERGHTQVNGARSWHGELAYCQELELAGFDDWRLPSIVELASIVEIGATEPAIDTSAFPDTPSMLFRSSTTFLYNDSPDQVWMVVFSNGITSYYTKPDEYGSVARCVRGGFQSG